MSAIISNTVTMMMQRYEQSAGYAETLYYCNLVFVSFFVVECLLKHLGLGPIVYWSDHWNKFDFVIVVLSLTSLEVSTFNFNASLLRVFRIARLFRMIKVSKGLSQLFKTLVSSIPSLVNVGTLLLLLLFIYAVAGMTLFSDVVKGEFLNEHANFENFYYSMITLFRCATGESWNGLLHDCMKEQQGISVIFFVSFNIVATLVFLNIFIAVILENFASFGIQQKFEMYIKPEDLGNFMEC